MSKEEEDEREDALAEVMDPMYLLSRGEADAEGEVDETIGGTAETNGYPNGVAGLVDAVDVFGE